MPDLFSTIAAGEPLSLEDSISAELPQLAQLLVRFAVAGALPEGSRRADVNLLTSAIATAVRPASPTPTTSSPSSLGGYFGSSQGQALSQLASAIARASRRNL